MEVVLNDDKLLDSEVDEISKKVRVFLIDKNNNILIANYNGVIMLPGGKVDKGETIVEALCRELNEELGQVYSSDELKYFMRLKHYQKNYPKMEDIIINRIVETDYYIGTYKEINKSFQQLSDKEKKGNFKLELVSLNDLEDIVFNNSNSNPRNKYFKDELLKVLSIFMCSKN